MSCIPFYAARLFNPSDGRIDLDLAEEERIQ